MRNELNDLTLKYFKNGTWLLVDFFIKTIINFLVIIYIARTIGPTNFGSLSLIIIWIAILITLTKFGIDSLIINRISSSAKDSEISKHLSAAIQLTCITSIIIGVTYTSTVLTSSYDMRYALLLIGIIPLTQIFYCYDLYLQGTANSKKSTKIKAIAMILAALLKITFTYTNQELHILAIAYISEHIIASLFLFYLSFKNKNIRISFKNNTTETFDLMKKSFPLFISNVSTILYMRLDQLMINYYLGKEQLGIYSSAIKYYELWTLFCFYISMAILPYLSKLKCRSEKEYRLKINTIFSSLTIFSIFITIFVVIFSKDIIYITFGIEYIKSSTALQLLILTAPFILFRNLSIRVLVIEGYNKTIMIKTLLVLLLVLSTNILLIPTFGINGAALGTLISIFIGYFISTLFDRETRWIATSVFLRFKK